MHFNFHLSGDESPEQSRRIANAVLALGGLPHTCDGAILATGVVNHVGAPTLSGEERAFLDEIMDRSEARFGTDLATGPDLTTVSTVENGKVTSTLVIDEVMTPDEVKAFVDQLPPPVPSTPEVSNVVPSTDKAGLPWDERIHSSSRAINADGTWRYRKNVPDETKRDVEAELRGLVATNGMDESEKEFEDAYSGPTIEVTTVEGTVNHVPAVPVPPTPPSPPTPPVPTGALQRTYSDVVNLIMARKVQPDTYVAILGMSLPEFAKHVISAPNDATLMFDALDQASHT